MAELGNETAAGAGGLGRLRASHADRDQVIGVLKAAFVQGRLAKDEFDVRVGQALASRTYADLAAVTADLPAGLAAAAPSRPARAQSEGRVRRPGLVLAVGTAVYAAVWPVALAFAGPSGPDQDPSGIGPLVMATFFYMIFLFVAGAMLVDTWQWKRSVRQLPPGRGPGAGGHTSPRRPSPDPGRQLPPGHSGRRHAAECQWRGGQRAVRTGQPLLET